MSDTHSQAQPGGRPELPDLLRNLPSSALADSMGIEFLEASVEKIVATMPVEGNTQPYGLLHGGASCVLAETLGSVGAALHGAEGGKIAVGLDINATHHRGVSSGTVTGTATPINLGGTIASYEIRIVDQRGRPVCTARLTCLLRTPPNDNEGRRELPSSEPVTPVPSHPRRPPAPTATARPR